jgi:hypothetical protein
MTPTSKPDKVRGLLPSSSAAAAATIAAAEAGHRAGPRGLR